MGRGATSGTIVKAKSLRVSSAIESDAAPQTFTDAGGFVRAIEVTQSVQSIDNAVTLIADKPTVVRIYLEPSRLPLAGNVEGELIWRRNGGGQYYLPSLNRVARNDQASLTDQRHDLRESLNFLLPAAALKAGALDIALNRVFTPGGSEIATAGPLWLAGLRFVRAPVLRIRVIGLRYLNASGVPVSPDAVHFAYLRSYLLRAYPIASLDWSQIVIDTDLLRPPFPPSASDTFNAQLSAIRRLDVASGMHSRTHYYGLVDNDRGRNTIRGSAVLDPTLNQFEFVASGPAGRGAWKWDTDESFADWYSAHELGHTYQRRHPGYPSARQKRDPADTPGYPYIAGVISNTDNRFVGFDFGDAALGLPMRALPGLSHSDFMTYGDHQWVSDYTYHGIFEQLRREAKLFGA